MKRILILANTNTPNKHMKKKNYAFVSDVARFDVLNTYGGIYLDTDVELIKPIERLLNNNLFMGYDQKGLIATGLIMGSEPKKKKCLKKFWNIIQKKFLSFTKWAS